MAHYMPPPMLAMFAPRPPVEYQPPREPKRARALTGLAAFKGRFQDPADLVPLAKHETAPEKRARRSKQRAAKSAARIIAQSKKWNPHENPKATQDPYKTLFVGRIDYTMTEDELRKEMETSGPVKSIAMVTDIKAAKPRGYAFVEFENEKDLKNAYKVLDGKKMKNKRVCVDVERGRTVPNWNPRRLGGGLGSSRKGDKKKKGAGGHPASGRRDESRSEHRPSSSRPSGEYESSRYRERRPEGGSRSYHDRDRGDRERSDRGYRNDRDYRSSDRGGERGGGERSRYRSDDRDHRGSQHSSYDEQGSSYRRSSGYDDDRRRDDRREPSGMPALGPPLPPQSHMAF